MDSALRLFAQHGYQGVSMRELAKNANVSLSVTYHYFSDKNILLKEVFKRTGTRLGVERGLLPKTTTAKDALRARIIFQFAHAEEIVFVLKYYLQYRESFDKLELGYLPSNAYLHIKEVLEEGIASGEFIDLDIDREAKVIAHAINGFVLEYYPASITTDETKHLVDDIATFIIRSIERR